jgi:hypothetical protein
MICSSSKGHLPQTQYFSSTCRSTRFASDRPLGMMMMMMRFITLCLISSPHYMHYHLRYDITIIPINTTFIENLIRGQIKLAVYSRKTHFQTTPDDPDLEFPLTTFLHDDFLQTEYKQHRVVHQPVRTYSFQTFLMFVIPR